MCSTKDWVDGWVWLADGNALIPDSDRPVRYRMRVDAAEGPDVLETTLELDCSAEWSVLDVQADRVVVTDLDKNTLVWFPVPEASQEDIATIHLEG